MKKPTGYIVYRGPSMIDGKKIVVVAITKSKNSKTGNMVQTHILVDNGKSPYHNAIMLKDSSICGNCIHRRGTGGSCYVDILKGPYQVFKGVQRGIYPYNPVEANNAIQGRMVRLGSYGDPAAVPRHVWDSLLKGTIGHTGYTHQWQTANNIADLVMASADSEKDRVLAKKKGYRTFRVRLENEPVLQGEFVCPASEEANKVRTCATCKACDGGYNTRKGDPVIISHGIMKNRFHNTNGLVNPDMGAFDFIKNPIKKFFAPLVFA